MSHPRLLEDQTIVVTGAASGIGRSTAIRVARAGARLIATDLSADGLQDLRTTLAPQEVRCVPGDVTDPQTLIHVMTECEGRVDGLANVAGIMDGFVPPSEVEDDSWNRVFAVNLMGPMVLCRAVLPGMIDRGDGRIVNVASEASFRASASGAAYTASKHALVGYTKSIAFFHGPQGVRANAVAPGAVATSIEGGMKSEYAAARVGPIMQAAIPGIASADDIAAAIVWLLSAESGNVNGAILPVDGGWSTV